jgi:hypothetical protein
MREECGENVLWKRPNEFIADFYITKEIITRYPLKNLFKFKKFIYEMYNHDTCPMDIKKKKNRESKKDANLAHYNSENKRLFKSFFKFLDKNDFYLIKLIEKEDNSNSNSNKIDDENINNNNNNENTKNENIKIANSTLTKMMTFGGSKILLDEKTSFFNKWISSILQFIREFEIHDEVKIFN